jgi:hypothetical protein
VIVPPYLHIAPCSKIITLNFVVAIVKPVIVFRAIILFLAFMVVEVDRSA